MAGYTRQSIADIINGAEITAPPLNAEFNQLSAAFNATTGHSHDGTSGNSPKINLTTSVAGYLPAAHGGVGGQNNMAATTNPVVTDDSTQGYAPGSMWENTTTGRIFICVGNASGAAVWRELVQVQTSNVIFPEVNDTVDLGSVTNRFQDLFLSGGIAASGNMSFGGTLNVNGSTALSSTLAVTGLSTLATVDINGGNIDGTVIGAATRAAGNFTTASTTGLATLASADINGGTIDGAVIGGSTATTVTGTNVTATTGFSGPLTGSVTGNVTGNLTGNVTGNVAGNVTGDVTSTGTSSFQNVTINGSLNMNAGTAATVTGLSAPVNGTDATTKTYVDAADAIKLNLSGGTMSGAIAMDTNKITGLGTPVNAADAATKGYVDTSVSNLIDAAPGALDTLNELASALGDDPNFSTMITNSIATKLPLAGGTMTGDITLGANKATSTATPTANDDLTRKGYVDTQVGTRLPLAGGTMTGAIAMGNSKITGLGTPTAGTDATTKTYVDGVDATKLNLSGGTMTGGIVMGANKITSTATPTAADDLTRKGYVDGILGSTTAAADSAAAASSSATSAANSASAALTSEQNADTSETNAANSAAAALTSEQNAASSAASINPNSIDINGGTIDGTVIGGSTPAAISGTTGQFGTSLNVDGTVTADGLVVSDADGATIRIESSDTSVDGGSLGQIEFYSNDSSTGGTGVKGKIETVDATGFGVNYEMNLYSGIVTGGVNTLRKQITMSNGDISFYEDTGTTPKFFWDASAERLGLGTTVPNAPLAINSATNGGYAQRIGVDDPGTGTTSSVKLGFDVKSIGSNPEPAAYIGVEEASTSSVQGALTFATRRTNNNTVAPTEAMRIDAAGSVGINNPAPDGDLTVGNTSVSGDISIRIKGDATSRNFLMFGDAGGAQLGDIMYDHSDNHMRFRVNNAERARIDASGDLLVGKTTDNQALAGVKLGTGGSNMSRNNEVLVLNRLSTDGTILNLKKDGTTVGSIGSNSGNSIYVGSAPTTIRFAGNSVRPGDGGGASRDNAVDLGFSTARWKDLYLSGGVYLGGTGSANLLDDYEAGIASGITLTAETSGSFTMNTALDTLAYTKIGRMVSITGMISCTNASATGTFVELNGLPFAAANLAETAGRFSGMALFDKTVGKPSVIGLGFEGNTKIRFVVDASAVTGHIYVNINYIAA